MDCMARQPIKAVPIKANTQAYNMMQEEGRSEVVTVEIKGRVIRLANFDGATGGGQKEEEAMKIDHLIGTILDELETQPTMPTVLIWDLNADPDQVPVVKELIEDQFNPDQMAEKWLKFFISP